MRAFNDVPPFHSHIYTSMIRLLFASAVLFAMTLADASAQTTPRPEKKTTPYSVRSARRKPPWHINPRTGKPIGYGVAPELKDGSTYLAPGKPMRKQVGYQGMGGYNDNRPHRPGIKKNANSSLNRDANTPAAKATRK